MWLSSTAVPAGEPGDGLLDHHPTVVGLLGTPRALAELTVSGATALSTPSTGIEIRVGSMSCVIAANGARPGASAPASNATAGAGEGGVRRGRAEGPGQRPGLPRRRATGGHRAEAGGHRLRRSRNGAARRGDAGGAPGEPVVIAPERVLV